MWTNTCCSHPLTSGGEQAEEGQLGASPPAPSSFCFFCGWELTRRRAGVRKAAARKLTHELGIPQTYELDEFAYLTRIHYYAKSDEVWAEHESELMALLRLFPPLAGSPLLPLPSTSHLTLLVFPPPLLSSPPSPASPRHSSALPRTRLISAIGLANLHSLPLPALSEQLTTSSSSLTPLPSMSTRMKSAPLGGSVKRNWRSSLGIRVRPFPALLLPSYLLFPPTSLVGPITSSSHSSPLLVPLSLHSLTPSLPPRQQNQPSPPGSVSLPNPSCTNGGMLCSLLVLHPRPPPTRQRPRERRHRWMHELF